MEIQSSEYMLSVAVEHWLAAEFEHEGYLKMWNLMMAVRYVNMAAEKMWVEN